MTHNYNIFKTIAFGIFLKISIVNFCYAQDRITGKEFATRSEVIAKNGMVATSHPLATQIGLDILKKVVMRLMLPLQQMPPLV